MTARVPAQDQDYMRRLGVFMAAVKADELARHRALPVEERLARSERLAKRGRPDMRVRKDPKDLAAFFQEARRLGLYRA